MKRTSDFPSGQGYTGRVKDAASHPWDRPAPEQVAGRSFVFGMLPEELAEAGVPGRADHVFAMLQRPWHYRDGVARVSREIRTWMAAHLDTTLPEVVERIPSSDGSTKLALRMADGAVVEAVHMPRDVRNPRVTLCISSQVGCAMGCAFCATGTMGIKRNLTAGEIVAQVLVALKELGPDRGHAVTLVFMGMGEPLHNLAHVHKAIRILNHPHGLNIGTRRITVSTSGIAPAIERLAELTPRPWLALSLNATTDAARNALMPVNRAYDLVRLRQALSRWNPGMREKLTIEYVLLGGVNDTDEDARRIAAWMGDLRFDHNINLIIFNAHEGAGFLPPEVERVKSFIQTLKAEGCFVTVRKSRGQDVQGACGQLARHALRPHDEA